MSPVTAAEKNDDIRNCDAFGLEMVIFPAFLLSFSDMSALQRRLKKRITHST